MITLLHLFVRSQSFFVVALFVKNKRFPHAIDQSNPNLQIEFVEVRQVNLYLVYFVFNFAYALDLL